MSRTQFLTLFSLALVGLFAAYLYDIPYAQHPSTMPPPQSQTTAIIVGSGLAGLSAASQLVAKNVPVRLLERGAKPGGNSIKASSGINGAPTKYQPTVDEAFYSDTIKSAGKAMQSFGRQREELISTLTGKSKSAIEWLVDEKGVDLSKVSILGGHTFPRTHRGAGQTPPGFAIVSALLTSLKESPLFHLQTSCAVTKLLQSSQRVTGLEYTDPDGEKIELLGPVIMASGGFGGDAEGLLAQFGRFISVGALKHYFNVSNTYVANKLWIVLFPWRHRPWSRQQRMTNNTQDVVYQPPREDINSPDMYIPMMALVTYILLSTLITGLRGAFKPELLGYTTTQAISVMILEILIIKLGTFLLNISSSSQLLDLVAYSGYKFVGVIVSLLLTSLFSQLNIGGGWISWVIFVYCFNANAFFLLRSLRYVLLPESNPQGVGGSAAGYTNSRSQKSARTNFLFIYSYLIQFGFMLWLSKV